jgi:hypothetical protein
VSSALRLIDERSLLGTLGRHGYCNDGPGGGRLPLNWPSPGPRCAFPRSAGPTVVSKRLVQRTNLEQRFALIIWRFADAGRLSLKLTMSRKSLRAA